MMGGVLRPNLRRLVWGLAGGLAALLLLQLHGLLNRQQEVHARALALGTAEALRASRAIDAELVRLEAVAQRVARDLNAGTLPPEGLPARLTTEMEQVPGAFRLGTVFAPFASHPGHRLFAPYVVRENGVLRSYQMEGLIDYTQADWYREGMASEGWGEPHLSRTTFQLVAGYRAHFKCPGSKTQGPDGMVRIDLSMDGIRGILAKLDLGSTGYGFLLSSKGVYLAHPKEDLVLNQQTLLEDGEELDEAARKQVASLTLEKQGGHVETLSRLGNLPVLLFVQPVPSSHWALGAAIFKSELAPSPVQVRRSLAELGCTLMALLALLGLLVFKVQDGATAGLWRWKTLVSCLLALGIGMLWSLTLAYPDPPADKAHAVIDAQGMNKYLQTKRYLGSGFKKVEITQVPTGLFLQTLRFGPGNDVILTGHAWQRFHTKTQAHLTRGLTFPDAETVEIKEAFRRQIGEFETVEYAFKATLRQSFENNAKYPFDQAVIRVRLWAKDFDSNVVLVPDLGAYEVMNPRALPGIEQQLVIPGWKQERSYFGFVDRTYNTNFGVANFVGQDDSPELCFQFVLARKFLDPFISTMLPVLVVACLLFTLLMASTKIKEKVAATGFKATDILRAAATLLFPVVFAQINLRSRLAVSGLIYLEYFYFVMYAVILLVAVNALAFSLGDEGALQRRDNALPKLLYWPVLLSAFFGISMVFLY